MIVQNPRITLEGAQLALSAALAEATAAGVAVAVEVQDSGGQPVAMARMDAAPAFAIEVASKKAWTAAATGMPTSVIGPVFRDDPVLLHSLVPKVDGLVALAGAVPILHEGAVAGAIGVSGGTEEQDQQIADAAVRAVGEAT